MSKSHPDHLIRGGQTMQHWLRMAAQVFRGGVAFAAAIYAACFIGLCLKHYRVDYLHLTWAHYMATFAVDNRGEPEREIRYKDPSEGWIAKPAEEILLDPLATSISLEYAQRVRQIAWLCLMPSGASFLLVLAFFYVTGVRIQGDEHVRGTRLVSSGELKRWSSAKWKAYRRQFGKDFKKAPIYSIAGIPFPPNAVEAQTAICGTVGVGKTNAKKELLQTIRSEGGKAIIYDRMGSFVRDFYDPETDVIINPFDARSRVWTPFHEADGPEFFTQIADVFVPDRPGQSDHFWTNSARIVFDYVARQIFKTGKWSNDQLRRAILELSNDALATLLDKTPGHHFFNEDIKKTSGSIRANLIAELRFLEFLRDTGPDPAPFSIRDWVKHDRPGFVFLTGDAEHAAATRNLISTIFEVAANALMTCQESHDPRVWFMMDEVPSLNKMPFLPRSLAQIRQFGGAFVVGYQVYAQLEDIYGEKGAQAIVGNLNNRIVFNTPDADTAERFSKSLGSEDVNERRESITVGAHETRDGVGFMAQRTERRIVTASQIQCLPQFTGYVVFAYDSPAALVQFEPIGIEPRAPKLVKYSGDGFATGQMTLPPGEVEAKPQASSKNVPFSELPYHEQASQFRLWLIHFEVAELEGPDVERINLAWRYFVFRRLRGDQVLEVGPMPVVFGPMMDGSGFEFPDGFKAGPCPYWLFYGPPAQAAQGARPTVAPSPAPATTPSPKPPAQKKSPAKAPKNATTGGAKVPPGRSAAYRSASVLGAPINWNPKA